MPRFRTPPHGIGRLATVALVLGAGCAEPEYPGFTRYPRHFADTLTVALESDTPVLVLETARSPEASTASYDSTIYSLYAGDSLRIMLDIRGFTQERNDPAVLDHHWDADTLFVWCAVGEPPLDDHAGAGDRTTPAPPLLYPDGVSVIAPLGVGITYAGERFY